MGENGGFDDEGYQIRNDVALQSKCLNNEYHSNECLAWRGCLQSKGHLAVMQGLIGAGMAGKACLPGRTITNMSKWYQHKNRNATAEDCDWVGNMVTLTTDWCIETMFT